MTKVWTVKGDVGMKHELEGVYKTRKKAVEKCKELFEEFDLADGYATVEEFIAGEDMIAEWELENIHSTKRSGVIV